MASPSEDDPAAGDPTGSPLPVGATRRRTLRRDARRNQERVLAAAVSAMLREGRQVPIAAEAGLGVGTLYRRYPSRDALLDALVHRSFQLLVDVAQQTEARPGSALSWLWDCVLAEREQLVLPLGGAPIAMSAHTLAVRAQLHDSLRRLLAHGQREGSIRDDVVLDDLIIFGAMLVTPLHGLPDWDRTAQRQKEIHLDGLSHTRRSTLSP